MPKETVYGQEVPAATADGEPRLSVVDVHWQRDHAYVQIATHIHDAMPIVLTAPADELERIKIVSGGEFVRCGSSGTDANRPAAAEWSILSAGSGFYVQLDRAGINALIRNLRRARDQAFGRDE